MGRHRTVTEIIGKQIDDYALNHLTMDVKSVSVFQGVTDNDHYYVSVQESGRVARQPKADDEQSHLIRSLKDFEPTAYEVPEGCAFCSKCGWRHKNRFS